ncbi:uncharacterized protein AMSG_08206 [Thecamonas trahens ATCC 50062]|uniref:Uncharacterized protein n=1 Tax=Thecamonas trahens ATCC 50062 TaxID=461836 RepID=A0A0L0DI92_THETB|nr:hypothetical protein AMSG_08206 [Thecamonas trahens ATCC 50062]KNC51960.1 hypothetical protein AMSG_08206 [Thecamonas trahens ATCC 50062]|eukprot:XP_013755547.1 hypothetical protein AMSG_08206 [Thecamonas trahens ATCC 50062]
MDTDHGQRLSLDEALFYGSTRVAFASTSGTVHGFEPSALSESSSPAAVASAAARTEPLGHLGPAYASLVVPAIPAPDIDVEKGPTACHELPQLLRELPLVKVPITADDGGQIVVAGDGDVDGTGPLAVASGIRSALVRVAGEWFRLKGCGNNDEGFVIREVETDDGRERGLVNIRGSSFEHTTIREMLMTHKIEAVATEIGMLSANAPRGWYVYELADDPFPLVAKVCSVFATRGDRRLADHVLVGLERMLGAGLSADTGLAALAALAAAGRAESASDVTTDITPTFIQALMGATGFVAGVGPDAPELGELDLAALVAASPHPALAERIMPELVASGALLPYLYWRFGWECGVFLAALHRAGISWGTYPDAMGMHCNAHSNNMVLLAPAQHAVSPGAFFLAPLDFDMAYSSASHAFDSDDRMAEYLVLERNGMLMALAGDEQLSTGVTGSAVVDSAFAPLAVVLRDTAAAAFTAGYDGGNDLAPYDPALTTSAYALIKLALLHTATDIA